MSHMVIYRGVDGKPGYHQTDDIHDAVNFVEQMRNEEGVEHARIFRLEEVVFEYRPYYRVELTDASSPDALVGENGTAALPESTEQAPSAQVGSGSGSQSSSETERETGTGSASQPAQVELLDEASDALDGAEVNGEVKADAGGAKKGLFGR
ncbi:MAG: hypothetical protein ACR2QK_17150 [Acidimicrobiales bacterium]